MNYVAAVLLTEALELNEALSVELREAVGKADSDSIAEGDLLSVRVVLTLVLREPLADALALGDSVPEPV